MAVTAKVPAKFAKHLMEGDVDLLNDTIKCALFTTLAFTQDTHEYFDAAPFTSNEVAAANGYAAGGATLANPAVTVSSLTAKFDADDPAWTVTGAGFTYRYAVYYDDTPASDKPVIVVVDFGGDVVAVAGSHAVVIDANGIARLVAS
jgi:hypothetical protein